jgi:S1-C subfamily serine protease
VICKVNGKVTRRKADFYAALYGTAPGDKLNLQVLTPNSPSQSSY